MRTVDQTVFTVPGGNCFSACVASILDLNLDEVPYFMGAGDWFAAFAQWLKPRGFYPLCINYVEPPAGLHILSGKSPRGDWLHSVVARGGDIVHDPHPSRCGVVTHVDAIVLVPFDPVAVSA